MAVFIGSASLARTAYASRKKDLQQDRDPDETIKVAAAIKSIVETTKEDLNIKEDSVGFWSMVKRRLEISLVPASTDGVTETSSLASDTAKAQRSAVTVVKSLAKNGVFTLAMKNDAAKAGVVVPLTKLIQLGANEGVKAAAVEALGLLVALAHAKNQELAFKAGAVDVLLPLLKTSRSATRVAAARCLACQVRHHSPSMNAVRHQGGLVTLVEMLQDSSRPEENDAGLEAAGWLMEGNRLNQTGFAENGLLVPLMDFMTEEDCQDNVKSALWVLTMLVKGHDRNLKLATEDQEVLALVVRHLELPKGGASKAPNPSASPQQYAIAALVEFMRDHADRSQRAVDYGAPKLLRRLTRPRHFHWRALFGQQPDSRLQRAARHALAMLVAKGEAPPEEEKTARKKRRKGRRRRGGADDESWWLTVLAEAFPTFLGIAVAVLAVWVVDYINTVTGFNYGFGEAGVYNSLRAWASQVENKLALSNNGESAGAIFSSEDFADFLTEVESSDGIDLVTEGYVELVDPPESSEVADAAEAATGGVSFHKRNEA